MTKLQRYLEVHFTTYSHTLSSLPPSLQHLSLSIARLSKPLLTLPPNITNLFLSFSEYPSDHQIGCLPLNLLKLKVSIQELSFYQNYAENRIKVHILIIFDDWITDKFTYDFKYKTETLPCFIHFLHASKNLNWTFQKDTCQVVKFFPTVLLNFHWILLTQVILDRLCYHFYSFNCTVEYYCIPNRPSTIHTYSELSHLHSLSSLKLIWKEQGTFKHDTCSSFIKMTKQ